MNSKLAFVSPGMFFVVAVQLSAERLALSRQGLALATKFEVRSDGSIGGQVSSHQTKRQRFLDKLDPRVLAVIVSNINIENYRS